MDDVHQKTILLKHTTVKVPGKRPPKATTPGQGRTFELKLLFSYCYVLQLEKVLWPCLSMLGITRWPWLTNCYR